VPRGRRLPTFSDAQEILQQLVSDGRVSTADVNRYREIRELEQRLLALREGGGVVTRRRGRPAGRPRGTSALTSEQRASRQLQGRYLALVRQIPAGKRAGFGQIAKEKGREAAIRAMQSVVGSGSAKKTVGRRRRRSTKLSGAQLASRQLQGRYLGLIRQIPASQRGRFTKISKDRGREAAIKEMRSALNK
jgi:O6-methylguanine-DNA--protein-cysteine methyltransferase